MRKWCYGALLCMLGLSLSAVAEEEPLVDFNRGLMDHGDGSHLMGMDGSMVMGQNLDQLPGGCDRISEERELTVHAGRKYASKFPGKVFAFDQQEWHFKPCTKLTVTFINEDKIRHQWMMHGLPKYIYKEGMFHLEAPGRGKITGTLILPNLDATLLVHCDMAQHMEKGLKAQLVIGNGGTPLPSLPGLTPPVVQDVYPQPPPPIKLPPLPPTPLPPAPPASAVSSSFFSGLMVIGIAFGLLGTPWFMSKFKGKSAEEGLSAIMQAVQDGVASAMRMVSKMFSK